MAECEHGVRIFDNFNCDEDGVITLVRTCLAEAGRAVAEARRCRAEVGRSLSGLGTVVRGRGSRRVLLPLGSGSSRGDDSTLPSFT